jgi:ribosomal protein S18 acetylase RimI-like enzyme
MESTLDLDLLTPLDWRVLRAARLGALRESPSAFTSSYARESRWAETEWRRVFDAAIWIVAREAEVVIGLASSASHPEEQSARHLESIWVAPLHRRRGVFRALLQALAETERRIGVTCLLLWVLEDNHDAQRAYEALGFEPTGQRQFLPAFGRFERQLRFEIPTPTFVSQLCDAPESITEAPAPGGRSWNLSGGQRMRIPVT